MGFLPEIQIASITGIWGITFTIMLFSSGIITTWYLRDKKNSVLLALTVSLGVILSVLGFGQARLYYNQEIASLNIGLLAIPETIKELKAGDSTTAFTLAKRLTRPIANLKKAGAEYILMPEKILTTKPKNNNQIIKKFATSKKLLGFVL
jgi:apolipoprotein N-acyltransferase